VAAVLAFLRYSFFFPFKSLFLKEITGWLMFAFMRLLFAFVLIVLLRLFFLRVFSFSFFFCVKWVGKMNSFNYFTKSRKIGSS